MARFTLKFAGAETLPADFPLAETEALLLKLSTTRTRELTVMPVIRQIERSKLNKWITEGNTDFIWRLCERGSGDETWLSFTAESICYMHFHYRHLGNSWFVNAMSVKPEDATTEVRISYAHVIEDSPMSDTEPAVVQ